MARGVKKTDAAIDEWMKEIAPSTKLRKWFSHDPERWQEFRRRYQTEIRQHPDEFDRLRTLAQRISYCRHDLDAANALADTLSKAGLSVWLDRKGIQEGAAFDTQIEEAIAQTSVVIVIWSEHSVKSHWVRAEAAYALGKHKLLPIS